MNDLGRLLFEQANESNERFAAGMQAAKAEARHDVALLISIYDRVQRLPDAKIPTALHLAVETLRQKYVAEAPANVQHMPR